GIDGPIGAVEAKQYRVARRTSRQHDLPVALQGDCIGDVVGTNVLHDKSRSAKCCIQRPVGVVSRDYKVAAERTSDKDFPVALNRYIIGKHRLAEVAASDL